VGSSTSFSGFSVGGVSWEGVESVDVDCCHVEGCEVLASGCMEPYEGLEADQDDG